MERLRKLFRRNPSAVFGLTLVALVLVGVLFAPALREAAYEQNVVLRLKPPFWLDGAVAGRFLGTDLLGRDLFARILFGLRVTLLVAVTAVACAGLTGIVLGLLAGYFGGFWDDLVMRFSDVLLSIPLVLLAISVMAAVRERGLGTLIAVIACTQWMTFARMVRAETLALKNLEYVEAARALGASNLRIIFRHILPGVLPTTIALTTLNVSVVVLIEAGLSYLGLGVQPLDPSLGYMLQEARTYLTRAPWLAIFPGITLMLVVLGVNLVGDWLRTIADPRSHRS